jgi:hypothetical protein
MIDDLSHRVHGGAVWRRFMILNDWGLGAAAGTSNEKMLQTKPLIYGPTTTI